MSTGSFEQVEWPPCKVGVCVKFLNLRPHMQDHDLVRYRVNSHSRSFSSGINRNLLLPSGYCCTYYHNTICLTLKVNDLLTSVCLARVFDGWKENWAKRFTGLLKLRQAKDNLTDGNHLPSIHPWWQYILKIFIRALDIDIQILV